MIDEQSEHFRLSVPALSVVIPTYQREQVLLNTIGYLLRLRPSPAEILVVDQTHEHEPATVDDLIRLERIGIIRWIRLPHPSITHAMNVGLQESYHEIVLFLDDDIIPDRNLIAAHKNAHRLKGYNIVAGQVLELGEEPLIHERNGGPFRFCSNRSQLISEFMGGNFSVKRKKAVELGGFDENFVQVAYRFEAEFAARALMAGEKILFEPAASIRHLKECRGGIRSYGQHLTTIKPSHTVGAFYYLLRSKSVPRRLFKILGRPLRAVRTKHHLLHPWWILPTLMAEGLGFIWAVCLAFRGPRLLEAARISPKNYE